MSCGGIITSEALFEYYTTYYLCAMCAPQSDLEVHQLKMIYYMRWCRCEDTITWCGLNGNEITSKFNALLKSSNRTVSHPRLINCQTRDAKGSSSRIDFPEEQYTRNVFKMNHEWIKMTMQTVDYLCFVVIMHSKCCPLCFCVWEHWTSVSTEGKLWWSTRAG